MIALAISLTGVLNFLLILAVLCLLLWGMRYLLGLMGVAIPQPVLAIVGFICLILVLLWFFGGGGPVIR